MNQKRRTFLKGISLGSGATVLSPMLGQMGLQAAGAKRGEFPQRFVFVVKSSGIIADRIEPDFIRPKLSDGGYINESLIEHPLPDTLSALESFKDQLGIVQGLSGENVSRGTLQLVWGDGCL